MDSEIARLCEMLRRIQALLTEVGETHWRAWIARDLSLIEQLDAYGLDHFLSAFGGMGSINDLVIHPMNGHHVGRESVDAVNQELGQLLGDANALAKNLRANENKTRNV
jgi:hypothetical protein